jgi:phosphoribosylformylglycinamidine synthase
LLDNFCWPDPVFSAKNPGGKVVLAQLVRTCQGLRDAVMAYETPLISGKDSMKNDFDDGVLRLSIPPTLLISAMGKIHDADSAVSMEFKQPGDRIYLLSAGIPGIGSSHYEQIVGWQSPILPMPNLKTAAEIYKRLHRAINAGLVNSAHDLSEGGLAVAVAECIIGSTFGAYLNLDNLIREAENQAADYPAPPNSKRLLYRIDTILFGEGPSRIVVTVPVAQQKQWDKMWSGMPCIEIGTVTEAQNLVVEQTETLGKPAKVLFDLTGAVLESAWKQPLPFD